METGLSGKVVIVTGATANIGRGIALAFAEGGARVVIFGRDSSAGELVVKLALEQGAPDAMWRAADMTVDEDVTAMFASMRRTTALTRQQARPPEIGAAAVYLASDRAAFVTGQVHQVDGGVMLV